MANKLKNKTYNAVTYFKIQIKSKEEEIVMDTNGSASTKTDTSDQKKKHNFVEQGFKEVDLEKVSSRIQDIRKILSSRVVGQYKAVNHVVRAFQKERLRNPNLPIATFLFAGPTGVGKTETAKEIARWLIGDDEEAPLVFIDGTNFTEPHSVSALIGAPPGYVGSNDDTALLSGNSIARPFFKTMGKLNEDFRKDYHKLLNQLDSVKSQRLTNSGSCTDEKADEIKEKKRDEFYKKWGPYKSVILFDEIEKACPEVWRILLNIIAEGKITLKSIGHEEVLFNNSIIILTTNMGSENLQNLITGKSIGFKNDDEKQHHQMEQDIYNVVKKAIEAKFPAELIGRLKENLIVFRPLDKKDYTKLVHMRIHDVLVRCVRAGVPISLRITQELEDVIIKKGFSQQYGARILNQKIEKYLVEPLSSAIESGQIKAYDSVAVDYNKKDGKVEIFTREKKFLV